MNVVSAKKYLLGVKVVEQSLGTVFPFGESLLDELFLNQLCKLDDRVIEWRATNKRDVKTLLTDWWRQQQNFFVTKTATLAVPSSLRDILFADIDEDCNEPLELSGQDHSVIFGGYIDSINNAIAAVRATAPETQLAVVQCEFSALLSKLETSSLASPLASPSSFLVRAFETSQSLATLGATLTAATPYSLINGTGGMSYMPIMKFEAPFF